MNPSGQRSPESPPLYLRLSVTDRCNLRCGYCRPDSGEFQDRRRVMSDGDILSLLPFVTKAVSVYKLRLTGGEPLVRPGLASLVEQIRLLMPDVELALTTNGLLLAKQANDLKNAGLESLNVSLDTMNPRDFRRITKVDGFADVIEGIHAAREAGFQKIRINAVLLRSFNAGRLRELALFARSADCELRLIELMPIGVAAEKFESESFSAHDALKELSRSFGEPVPLGLSGTAYRYRFPDAARPMTIGIISTISSPFCDHCDRLRIDSRGVLYPCLHDYDGLDLLGLVRKGMHDAAVGMIRSLHTRRRLPISDWTSQMMVGIGG